MIHVREDQSLTDGNGRELKTRHNKDAEFTLLDDLLDIRLEEDYRMVPISLPWVTGRMVVTSWDEILGKMIRVGSWVECEFPEIQLSEGS